MKTLILLAGLLFVAALAAIWSSGSAAPARGSRASNRSQAALGVLRSYKLPRVTFGMTTFGATRVQRYYDNNTKLLLTLGQGSAGTIHRAVWAPGIRSRADALAYVDGLICKRVAQMREAGDAPLHVVDLGCGVCATLCQVGRQTDSFGTGITISPRQVSIASERIKAEGLDDRITCRVGDFCDLPSEIPRADVAYAIESFVHATSARAFFEHCARLIRPGGVLLLCDDFLTHREWRTNARAYGSTDFAEAG